MSNFHHKIVALSLLLIQYMYIYKLIFIIEYIYISLIKYNKISLIAVSFTINYPLFLQ